MQALIETLDATNRLCCTVKTIVSNMLYLTRMTEFKSILIKINKVTKQRALNDFLSKRFRRMDSILF